MKSGVAAATPLFYDLIYLGDDLNNFRCGEQLLSAGVGCNLVDSAAYSALNHSASAQLRDADFGHVDREFFEA